MLNTVSIGKTLEWIFLILLPNYCLGQGMLDLYDNYQYLSLCKDLLPLCQWNITLPCCKGKHLYWFNDNFPNYYTVCYNVALHIPLTAWHWFVYR